jgi:hypothetical protein
MLPRRFRRTGERRARDGKKTFGACADALLDAKKNMPSPCALCRLTE